MKRMKKIVSMLLAVVMVLGMSLTVFAAEENHTITITNTDQNVSHTYVAYQVFKGNLNAAEDKLSDVQWGSGVNAIGLINALKATTEDGLTAVKNAVANVDTLSETAVAAAAKDVAKALESFSSTTGENESAGAIDAFATIVANNINKENEAARFTETDTSGVYTAEVQGDGYYFIKDETENLEGDEGSDTLSKYLLSVVKNTTIVAKDTGLTPNKSILIANGTNPEEFIKVKEGTAAIGDTVTFVVDDINVPNTKKYEKKFVFVMNDQLDPGLTFMGISSIKIGNKILTENTDYTVTAKTGNETEYTSYTAPEKNEAAVTAEGGQAIKVVFNDFKKFVEENDLIGQQIVITYTAVVNDDAVYGATGNENEVTFDYSKDPNYDYDGDEPGPNDPIGTTPESKTKTYVTALEIFKYTPSSTETDDDGKPVKNPLAGAEFEITGTAYNITLVTGERFDQDTNGEYWKLKDGSYTKTDPNAVDDEGNKLYNDEQYESTTIKYSLVKFEEEVTTPKDTKITVISDENGRINISGLKPGTYTVKETKAPEGYNKIDDEFELVIAWDRTTAQNPDNASGGFSIGDGSNEGWTMTEDGALFKIDIMNQSGALLPSTGGIGTTIFYVVGGILVIGAGILLVAKKRMSNR